MMNISPCLTIENVERSILKVCDHIDRKRESLVWTAISEEQLWYQLVSCILGSQVHYETAKACVDRLINHGLIDIQVIQINPAKAKERITKELSKPVFPPIVNGKGSKYRYPKSKADFIVSTCLSLYKNNSPLSQILENCTDPFEARDLLIKKCKGIGPKQASLFLRNVSYSVNLAIIDSHIIDFLKLMKLNEEIDTRIIANKSQYLKNEKILLSYADDKKRTLASLDYAIWVVMRLIKREYVT